MGIPIVRTVQAFSLGYGAEAKEALAAETTLEGGEAIAIGDLVCQAAKARLAGMNGPYARPVGKAPDGGVDREIGDACWKASAVFYDRSQACRYLKQESGVATLLALVGMGLAFHYKVRRNFKIAAGVAAGSCGIAALAAWRGEKAHLERTLSAVQIDYANLPIDKELVPADEVRAEYDAGHDLVKFLSDPDGGCPKEIRALAMSHWSQPTED